MRVITIALVAVILLLQYKLWFGTGNVLEVMRLRANLERQMAKNTKLKARNTALEAEIVNLKTGHHALEERARSELGLVREGETYYQLAEKPHRHTQR